MYWLWGNICSNTCSVKISVIYLYSHTSKTLLNIVGGYRIDRPVSIRMLHMSAMAAINYNSSGQKNCDISFDMHNKWSISILNQHWVKWQAYYAEHKTNKESLIQNIGYEFQMSFQFPKVSWMPLTERLCIKCHWILTFVFCLGEHFLFCSVGVLSFMFCSDAVSNIRPAQDYPFALLYKHKTGQML